MDAQTLKELKKKVTNVNAGDVVYFSKMRKSSKLTDPEIFIKGSAFAVLLGQLKAGQPDPQPHELFQMMGRIGFLTFDDVAEFLGEENAKICLEKFTTKHYGALVEENPTEQKPEPSALLNSAGQAFDADLDSNPSPETLDETKFN